MRDRKEMRKAEIAALKEKVSCGALLERAGFAIDVKESTRRAVKFRRGGEIVIVTHEGKGWFDPLSDDKGDIFALVRRLDHVGFVEGVESVASLVGFQTSDPVWEKAPRERPPATSLADRWSARRIPWRGSATWRYLSGARFLPSSVLRMAITSNQLREGPYEACGRLTRTMPALSAAGRSAVRNGAGSRRAARKLYSVLARGMACACASRRRRSMP